MLDYGNYNLKVRSQFFAQLLQSESGEVPNKFTFARLRDNVYNGGYENEIVSFEGCEGLFFASTLDVSKAKNPIETSFSFYVFSKSPTDNKVTKKTCKFEESGNDTILTESIEQLSYPMLSSLGGIALPAGFYASNTPVFTTGMVANACNLEPYTQWVIPFDKIDNQVRQALKKIDFEYWESSGHAKPRIARDNKPNTYVNFTSVPIIFYKTKEQLADALEDLSNGNWESEWNTEASGVNWTLHVNGNIKPDFVLDFKTMIPESKQNELYAFISVYDFDLLCRLPVNGDDLMTDNLQMGYNPDNGTITPVNGEAFANFSFPLSDKHFSFSFDELYAKLVDSMGTANILGNYLTENFVLGVGYGKIRDDIVKNAMGFFSIKNKCRKLDYPVNFTLMRSRLAINANYYTYDMGFLTPLTYNIGSGEPVFDNSTITVKWASDGIDDNPDLADDDDAPKDDIIQEDDATNTLATASGTLTTTYKIDENTTKQIGGFLWRNNIFENFELLLNSPIENLLSVKMIPVDAPAGNQQPIVIGNVDLETIGGREVTSTNVIINIGTVDMSQLNKYGNFIDLPPYTKYVIYLPYIGFREFDGSCCLNKSLNVRYSIDLITGACLAMLYVSNKFKIAEYEGNIGIDIPISASNRGNTESAIISGLADAAISLNPVNIPSAIANSVFAQYSYQSKGAPSPTCLASANRTCYILIDRPQYTPIKSFAHTRGLYCNKTKTIGNCKGFTICDANIDLSNIPLTSGEIDELRQILSSGFYA